MGLLTLIARLAFDTSNFDAGMNRAQSSASRFASQIRGRVGGALAGAFSIGAITAFTRATINSASHMRDLSDRLGVNVEWLQEMQFAAKQAGSSVDDLTSFMEKLAVARSQALGDPKGKTASAFAKFAIGQDTLKNAPLQSLVDQIGRSFGSGSTQALIPALREVGGKGAGALTAAFVNGIEQGRAAARNAGVVISEDLIDQLDAVDDGFARLSLQLKAGIAPAIIVVADTIQAFINQVKQFAAQLGGAAAGRLTTFEKVLAVLSPQTLVGRRLFSKDAMDAVVAEEADQQNLKDQAGLSAKADREARRRRERTPLEFEPLKIKSETIKRDLTEVFDPLRKIGAFSQGSDTGFKLVSLQERIARATERTAENTGEGPL